MKFNSIEVAQDSLIAARSVAFTSNSSGKIRSCGSGTLVKFRDRYGILTAGHVWEGMMASQEIGLCLLGARGGQQQGISLEVAQLSQFVTNNFCSSNREECGPDLAFIPLQLETLGQVKSLASFYRISEDEVCDTIEDSQWFLACSIGELDEEVSSTWVRKTLEINGAIVLGDVEEFNGCAPQTRIKYTPEQGGCWTAINSWGGASGGGLWTFRAQENPRTAEDQLSFDCCSRLSGVAYWESPKASSGARYLVCHNRNDIAQFFDSMC